MSEVKVFVMDRQRVRPLSRKAGDKKMREKNYCCTWTSAGSSDGTMKGPGKSCCVGVWVCVVCVWPCAGYVPGPLLGHLKAQWRGRGRSCCVGVSLCCVCDSVLRTYLNFCWVIWRHNEGAQDEVVVLVCPCVGCGWGGTAGRGPRGATGGRGAVNHMDNLPTDIWNELTAIHVTTVKHFLFAKTLFSRKFARAERRENKVLANNSLHKATVFLFLV